MADRRAELERKKLKLAEIRALKEARGKAQVLQPAKVGISLRHTTRPFLN